MAVEGVAKVLKWLLFAFNLVFWLIGLVVLGLGVWLFVAYGKFLNELGGVQYLNVPILFITVGSIIAALGFLGCFSACTENKCCLRFFASVLVLTLILELVAGILAYVNRSAVGSELEKQLRKSMKDYDTSAHVKSSWDFLQTTFDCCGTRNGTEWRTDGGSGFRLNNATLVPNSCCSSSTCPSEAKINAHPHSGSNYTVWERGCYEAIKSQLTGRYVVSGAVAIVLFLIQIAGVAFALIVANAVGEDDGTVLVA